MARSASFYEPTDDRSSMYASLGTRRDCSSICFENQPRFPDAGTLYPTSLLIGAMLALGPVYVGVKTRAQCASHGVEIEPTGFFVLKNVILFVVIIYFT